MARVHVPDIVVVGVAFAVVGCGPPPAASTVPTEAVAASPSAAESPLEVDEPKMGLGADGGFLVTLESRCRDKWNGVHVRSAAGGTSGFEISKAAIQKLRLQPGDSLLLTSPHGGILDVHFDGVSDGYGARVEVNSECSGVKRTLVRDAALASDL